MPPSPSGGRTLTRLTDIVPFTVPQTCSVDRAARHDALPSHVAVRSGGTYREAVRLGRGALETSGVTSRRLRGFAAWRSSHCNLPDKLTALGLIGRRAEDDTLPVWDPEAGLLSLDLRQPRTYPGQGSGPRIGDAGGRWEAAIWHASLRISASACLPPHRISSHCPSSILSSRHELD